MAISPKAVYPGQTDDTDPDYPLGKARNATTLGDGTGFPIEQRWVNDLLGFQQALLDEAGISPSGNPDKVGASQYLDALAALFFRKGTDPVVQVFDTPGTYNWNKPDQAQIVVVTIIDHGGKGGDGVFGSGGAGGGGSGDICTKTFLVDDLPSSVTVKVGDIGERCLFGDILRTPRGPGQDGVDSSGGAGADGGDGYAAGGGGGGANSGGGAGGTGHHGADGGAGGTGNGFESAGGGGGGGRVGDGDAGRIFSSEEGSEDDGVGAGGAGGGGAGGAGGEGSSPPGGGGGGGAGPQPGAIGGAGGSPGDANGKSGTGYGSGGGGGAGDGGVGADGNTGAVIISIF